MEEHIHGDDHIRELEKAKKSARRLERLLGRSETAVQQSLGIRALEKVAGEIAVCFKDIMSAVAGYGRVLHREMDRKDPLRKYAALILAHAETGRNITNRLISVGERGKVSLTSTEINQLVLQMSRFLAGIIRKGVGLRTELTDGDLTVMADPTQMGAVLASLVNHVSGVTCSGGSMTILTRHMPVENCVAGEPAGSGCALLSVRSDDVSPSRVKAREPGWTRGKKGVLLAVSAVRRIIEEHGGAMRVAGQRGRTVEFNIYLPVLHGGQGTCS